MRVKFLTSTEPLVENCWSRGVTGSLIAGFGRTRLLMCVKMLTTYTRITPPMEWLDSTNMETSSVFIVGCTYNATFSGGLITFALTFSAGLASFKRTGQRKVLSVFSN